MDNACDLYSTMLFASLSIDMLPVGFTADLVTLGCTDGLVYHLGKVDFSDKRPVLVYVIIGCYLIASH